LLSFLQKNSHELHKNWNTWSIKLIVDGKSNTVKALGVELFHCLFQFTQQQLFDIRARGSREFLVIMVMKVLLVTYWDS